MQEWLTGISRAASALTVARTVVVENPNLVPSLMASGLLDSHSQLIMAVTDPPASVAGHPASACYRGTFAGTDSQLDFDTGHQLTTRHYGAAEFLSYDTDTILRITDADDFSAFLRDADRAWMTGRFPDHLTHPNVIVADLAALGGVAGQGGPYRRLFVFPDATVSTSPTGAALGSTADGIATLDYRWRAANEASAHPDAVCLARVVPDSDRSTALLERPWVARFLVAIGIIRSVREGHRSPGRVSGFGGRISAGLPDSADPDAGDAPILLQIGRTNVAHDPVTGLGLAISAAAVAMVESLLAHPNSDDAAGWCVIHLGIPPRQLPSHLLGTLRLLADAGVATRWSDRAALHWGNGPPAPAPLAADRPVPGATTTFPTDDRKPVPSGPP